MGCRHPRRPELPTGAASELSKGLTPCPSLSAALTDTMDVSSPSRSSRASTRFQSLTRRTVIRTNTLRPSAKISFGGDCGQRVSVAIAICPAAATWFPVAPSLVEIAVVGYRCRNRRFLLAVSVSGCCYRMRPWLYSVTGGPDDERTSDGTAAHQRYRTSARPNSRCPLGAATEGPSPSGERASGPVA